MYITHIGEAKAITGKVEINTAISYNRIFKSLLIDNKKKRNNLIS